MKSDILAVPALLALLETTSATPAKKRAVTPSVKSANVLGTVADPAINRDSCAAIKVGSRALWTCRDSQPYDSSGKPTLPVWSSSASWADFNADGTPGTSQYGTDNQTPYYPIPLDECSDNTAGVCSDGTRFAIWPDSPPMVTSGDDSSFVGYTWIRDTHINGDLSPVTTDPQTSLYKVTFDTSSISDNNALPSVNMLSEAFWAAGAVPFGAYGNVVKDGTAYLYGKPDSGNVFLAKVDAGSVEDTSQYQYWVDGAWGSSPPATDDTNSSIQNLNNGQGTFYWSDAWSSYVWIGQPGISVSADFMITTAPDPTGPWESVASFYQGENGSANLAAYSLQANPALSADGANEIYISYTKGDTESYSTQMIQIEWN